MWLDRGEWEALRAAGLHARLHTFFADSWQHHLRHQEARRLHEQRLRALLGDESLDRAREFKEWLRNHPHRNIIAAYLEDRDVP
jgi:hypothetical protein